MITKWLNVLTAAEPLNGITDLIDGIGPTTVDKPIIVDKHCTRRADKETFLPGADGS